LPGGPALKFWNTVFFGEARGRCVRARATNTGRSPPSTPRLSAARVRLGASRFRPVPTSRGASHSPSSSRRSSGHTGRNRARLE
jgi:hypothetical protein